MRRALFLAEFAFLTAGMKAAAATMANHFVIVALIASAVVGSGSTSSTLPPRDPAFDAMRTPSVSRQSTSAEDRRTSAVDETPAVPVEDLTLELDDEQLPTAPRGSTRKPVDLSAEIRMLDQARTAIRANNPSQGLVLLGQYVKRYPKGSFRQEAAVLRIEALAVAGSRSQAASEAARFIANNPRSPHVEKLKRLLRD
jgi:hypothetical protein